MYARVADNMNYTEHFDLHDKATLQFWTCN